MDTINELLYECENNYSDDLYQKLLDELDKVRLKALTSASNLRKTIYSGKYKVYNTLDDIMVYLAAKCNRDKIFIHVKEIKKYILFDSENDFAEFVHQSLPRNYYAGIEIITATLDNFLKLLPTYGNMMINIIYGSDIYRYTTVNTNIKESQNVIHTIKFITANPPVEKEKKDEYYNRYKNYCHDNKFKPINKKFGKIMNTQGYEERHTGPLFYWDKSYSIAQFILYSIIPQLDLEESTQYEYIYFITETPFTNKVKIGKAKNAEKRLKTLQTGNPNKLCIYHKIYAPISNNMEYVLHKQYSTRRINGEWFNFTNEELDNEIKTLQ
jgi:hypothetical protein